MYVQAMMVVWMTMMMMMMMMLDYDGSVRCFQIFNALCELWA